MTGFLPKDWIEECAPETDLRIHKIGLQDCNSSTPKAATASAPKLNLHDNTLFNTTSDVAMEENLWKNLLETNPKATEDNKQGDFFSELRSTHGVIDMVESLSNSSSGKASPLWQSSDCWFPPLLFWKKHFH
jgi:hypothetical protein